MPAALRCYCCGSPVGPKFAVVTMSPSADRVFIMSLEHARRALDVTVIPVELTQE